MLNINTHIRWHRVDDLMIPGSTIVLVRPCAHQVNRDANQVSPFHDKYKFCRTGLESDDVVVQDAGIRLPNPLSLFVLLGVGYRSIGYVYSRWR